MKLNNKLIPAGINDWELRTEMGKEWGIAPKIKLPEIKQAPKGTYFGRESALENIEAIVQKIKFESLYSGITPYVQIGKRINFRIAAAVRLLDCSDPGGYVYELLKITESGIVKGIKFGCVKIENSNEITADCKFDTSGYPKLEVEVDCFLVELAGQELLYINRATGQYRINGVSQIPKGAAY